MNAYEIVIIFIRVAEAESNNWIIFKYLRMYCDDIRVWSFPVMLVFFLLHLIRVLDGMEAANISTVYNNAIITGSQLYNAKDILLYT